MREPFLQRLGGTRGVARLSFRLNDLVMASDRLRPVFEGVDLPRLVDHQAAFIVSALGGRPDWSDADLPAMHAGLGIGEAELDEMLALLSAAIIAEGYPESEAERMQQQARRARDRLLIALGGGSPDIA